MIATEAPSGSEHADLDLGRWFALTVLCGLLSIDLGEHRWPEGESVRFVLFLALAIAGAIATTRESSEPRSPGERALMVALTWVVLSSVLSVDPVARTVAAAAVAGTFLLGAAARRNIENPLHVWSAVVVGIFGALLVGAALGPQDNDTRWLGLSEEPNGLAVVAAIGVVVGITVGHRRRFAWLVAALGCITLAATNAAIPALAAAVGTSVWLTRHWSHVLRRSVATVGAVAVAAALLAIYWLPTDALPGDGYNLETLNERTRLWSYLMEDVAEAPLLGHGARATHDLMALGAFDDRVHWGPTHGHSAWIEMTVAGGWPAGVLFVIGIGSSLVAAFRRRDATAGVLVTIAILAATEPLVRDPTIAVLVLGVASVSMSSVPAAVAASPHLVDDRTAG